MLKGVWHKLNLAGGMSCVNLELHKLTEIE